MRTYKRVSHFNQNNFAPDLLLVDFKNYCLSKTKGQLAALLYNLDLKQ